MAAFPSFLMSPTLRNLSIVQIELEPRGLNSWNMLQHNLALERLTYHHPSAYKYSIDLMSTYMVSDLQSLTYLDLQATFDHLDRSFGIWNSCPHLKHLDLGKK